MNFPLEYPLFRFLYWLINTDGVGGITAILVGLGSVSAYFMMVRWIASGSQADESEAYAYPTPTLLGHVETSDTPARRKPRTSLYTKE
jgi:hypothetical protein